MMEKDILNLLKSVAGGKVKPEDALKKLKMLPYIDIGIAKIDTHRTWRKGFPESIFCQGKTVKQIASIAQKLYQNQQPFLATKVSPEAFQAIKKVVPEIKYHEAAKLVSYGQFSKELKGLVAVVTAGTSDIPIAEEAALTAQFTGSHIEKVYDVGVAGAHRLFSSLELLQKAKAIVVIAGMEGALPSLVAGLVPAPVIGVPTSIGYGASLKGFAPLLTMLNSCAEGLAVVNIDNGFGAGYLASIINLQSQLDK
jgi:hypothetical protein